MTDGRLREAVLSKLAVSPQAISQQIQRLKRTAPMSTKDGWAVIAHMKGLDISKFLAAEDVQRIRDIYTDHFRGEPAGVNQPNLTKRRQAQAPRSLRISIAPNLQVTDLLLSATVVAEAKIMAERVYPLVYLLENSMRAFITRIMTATHGHDWWNVAVPANVKGAVSSKMTKAEKVHWHGKRAADPIFYTDTPHLIDIVDSNWGSFKPYLPTKEFFVQRLREINESRRAVAHNNPLADNDRKRLEVYFRDWEQHIGGIQTSLP